MRQGKRGTKRAANPTKFGEALYDSELYVYDMADALNVTPKTVSSWVRGASYPCEEHANKAAELLGWQDKPIYDLFPKIAPGRPRK